MQSKTKTHVNLQLVLAVALFFQRHPFLVLFVVFSFGRLQIEPGVRERLDKRQQRLDERMKLILFSAAIQTVIQTDRQTNTYAPRIHNQKQREKKNVDVG